MFVCYIFMNTRRKLGLYAQALFTVTPALGRAILFVGE
jgi:hypothetical protein